MLDSSMGRRNAGSVPGRGRAPTVEEYLNDARTVPPTELETEIWLPLR